ncbi:MAG: DUF707 domain-containing protein [Verrucomicrobiota bacterium]
MRHCGPGRNCCVDFAECVVETFSVTEEKTQKLCSALRQARFSRDIAALEKALHETRAELAELKETLARKRWFLHFFRAVSSFWIKLKWAEFWRRQGRSIRKRCKAIFGTKEVVSPVLQSQVDQIRRSGYFDAAWYQRRYPKAASAADPIAHYVEIGARKDWDPNPLFDSRMYRRAHALSAEENPLVHFLDAGAKATAGAYPTLEAFQKMQKGFYDRTGMRVIKDSRPGGRRFAVFLQCSARSIHREWFTQAPRTWDLVVNLFQEQSEAPEGSDLVLRQTGGGSGAAAIAHMMQHFPEIIGAYDYWMLLDDDILTTVDDLNLLFEIVDEMGLDMAQPGLSKDSYIAHPVLFADSRGETRKLNTVELMAPILSRRLLEVAGHLFSESVSGYGADFAMGKITRTQLGTDPTIVDAVSVRHCRVLDNAGGEYYRFLQQVKISPIVELRRMTSKYGVENIIRAF